jgi:hypothetical protein
MKWAAPAAFSPASSRESAPLPEPSGNGIVKLKSAAVGERHFANRVRYHVLIVYFVKIMVTVDESIIIVLQGVNHDSV